MLIVHADCGKGPLRTLGMGHGNFEPVVSLSNFLNRVKYRVFLVIPLFFSLLRGAVPEFASI